jgi:hypothetical protein
MLARKRDRPRMSRPIGAPPWVERVAVATPVRSRLKARREMERRSSRVRNEAYLDTCRSRKTPDVRCLIKVALGRVVGPCSGAICPDHQRDMTGGGQRESDIDSYPACWRHHMAMERFAVPGAETRESRKALRATLIAAHHVDLQRAGHPAAPPIV